MPDFKRIKILPSAGHLRACFDYDPKIGELRWKRRPREHFPNKRSCSAWNARYPGTIAGTIDNSGHRSVLVNYRSYLAHRIIWKLMTGEEPPPTIDHGNRNPGDNRWTNLRPATCGEQVWNSRLRKDNRSGRRGVSPHEGKWQAQINIRGTFHYLGRFETVEEASAAFEAAAREVHGIFYRPPSSPE